MTTTLPAAHRSTFQQEATSIRRAPRQRNAVALAVLSALTALWLGLTAPGVSPAAPIGTAPANTAVTTPQQVTPVQTAQPNTVNNPRRQR